MDGVGGGGVVVGSNWLHVASHCLGNKGTMESLARVITMETSGEKVTMETSYLRMGRAGG